MGEIWIDWGHLPDGSPRHSHSISLYFRTTVDETQLPAKDRFFGYDEAGRERYSLEYVWVPLEELSTLTVYPPEAARHLLDGCPGVLHFEYTELPEDTPWPE